MPDRFGPGLPAIRDWVEGHYDFAGYVTGFDPAALGDRDELRQRLGYRPDEQVCVVTVGGSGVGGHLLRRVIAAYPEARRLVPGLRMVVVAGPRIDPASLPAHDGLEVHAYVHELYRHLAAADLAVVQGGLTTCMELTAAGRPFLYFPLRPPLRAELPRRPPAAPVRRRPPHGLRHRHPGGDRRRHLLRDRPPGRLPPGGDRRRRPAPPA